MGAFRKWLSLPVLSDTCTGRLLYNMIFVGWLFLLVSATLSLTRLPLTENELFLGGFLLMGFNFLAGILLVLMQLLLSRHQEDSQL